MSKEELINVAKKLIDLHYCKLDGQIMIFPDWLDWKILTDMESAGIAFHKFYKNFYGHTEFYINIEKVNQFVNELEVS